MYEDSMEKFLIVNYMEVVVHSCVRQSFERIEINGYSTLSIVQCHMRQNFMMFH